MIPKNLIIFLFCTVVQIHCLLESDRNETYIFANVTNCFLFYTRSITINQNIGHNSHVTLLNSSYNFNGSECVNNTASLFLSFDSVDQIQNASFNLNFVINNYGYWVLTDSTFSIHYFENTNFTSYNGSIIATWLTAPVGYSYHCSSPPIIVSDMTSISFDKLQVQAFNVDGDKFSSANDCIGLFSIGIWSIILSTVVLLTILSIGLQMTLNIKTQDRLDDPKGKGLQISSTD